MSSRSSVAVVFVAIAGCGHAGPSGGPPTSVAIAPAASSGAVLVAAPPVHARGRVVDFGLGWQSSCALLDDTTVRCWGRNNEGAVGDGTDDMRTKPTPVTGASGLVMNEIRKLPRAPEPLKGVQQIAVGHESACARMQDGTVKCWGRNNYGEGGGGTPWTLWTPREVPGLRDVVEIAGGDYHRCARLAGGKVRCWGGNYWPPTPKRKPIPRPVGSEEILGLTDPVKLVMGASAACAISKGGSVSCWEARNFAEGSTHTAVRVPGVEDAVDAWVDAEEGGCARKKSGAVVCWGRLAKTGQDLAQLSWAQGSSCSLTRSGDAQCWGHYAKRLAGVRKVAPGGTHACALRDTGTLLCWGTTEYGQLGEGSGRVRAFAAAVRGLGDKDAKPLPAATALGRGGSCALLGSDVVCWGSNEADLLGRTTVSGYSPVPVQLDALRGVTQLASRTVLACAVRDGSAFQWNRETAGVPERVAGIPEPVVEVAVGDIHTCARVASGAVWCWGDDGGGQLGRGVSPKDGDDTSFPVPAAVKGISDAVGLALGGRQSCARLTTGRVKCWGRNTTGILGNGSRPAWVSQATPVLVKGLDDVVQIAMADTGSHACALKKDGSMMCWGHDTYGEFGTWDEEKEGELHATPVAAKGLRPAREIATAEGTTCARFDDGTVQCWGGNQWGEIGDGTTTVRARPVTVAGVTDAVELASGQNHFCARTKDGVILCWGRADLGTLGGGAVHRRDEPIEIAF